MGETGIFTQEKECNADSSQKFSPSSVVTIKLHLQNRLHCAQFSLLEPFHELINRPSTLLEHIIQLG